MRSRGVGGVGGWGGGGSVWTRLDVDRSCEGGVVGGRKVFVRTGEPGPRRSPSCVWK